MRTKDLSKLRSPADDPEMPFLDHLEALRWHLLRPLGVWAVGAIIAFCFKHKLFHYLILAPAQPHFPTYQWLCTIGKTLQIRAFCIDTMPFILQSRHMSGQLTMHVTASIVLALVATFPYLFWEIWRFVKPGLKPNERQTLKGATAIVSMCFFIGVLVGYFVITPIAVHFLAHYQVHPSVLNEFDIVSYVSTVAILVLSCGIIFLLPTLMYALARVELLSAHDLRKHRRHALLVILFLSAMITPPDPFSQLFMALPLVILYEISILVVNKTHSPKTTPHAHG